MKHHVMYNVLIESLEFVLKLKKRLLADRTLVEFFISGAQITKVIVVLSTLISMAKKN